MLKSLGEEAPISATSGENLKSMPVDYSSIDAAIVDFEFNDPDIDGSHIIEFLHHKGVQKIYLSSGYIQDDCNYCYEEI